MAGKAQLAGNVEHIVKSCNTASRQARTSRRAHHTGPVTSLHSLAMYSTLPAECASPQNLCDALSTR